MTTTTIRVDEASHAALVELSRSGGTTLIETVRQATEALRRQRFAQLVVTELAELREDHDSWVDYLGEIDESSFLDGIG
jgi:hypothetical protein